MSQHDDVIPDSTYEPLKAPPQFVSQIPEYLLADATPQDRYIMSELSIGAQCNQWLIKTLQETHSQVRKTNGRLIRAEENIKAIQGETDTVKVGWKVIAKITGIIVIVLTLIATIVTAIRSV